ncbi:MAG: transporter permease subunit [Herbinix sp.]|jgi:hypothetical protein|nr:transporter permease subunit [Herbinix sp.]
MNSIKQLFRQPIRSVIYITTLMLSGTILCLSIGLYYSARITIREADSIYTTIALPTDRTETKQEKIGDEVWESKQSVITNEAREWMNSLKDTYPEVCGEYQQQFISAYSEGLDTLVSAMEEGSYSYSKDTPYTNAAFVITIESMYNDKSTCKVDITAKIQEALFLHSGYKLPEKSLRLYYQYFTDDEWNASDLEVGGTYLVFGINYNDSSLSLKQDLAEALKISISEVNWDNLNYDIGEYVSDLESHDYDTSNIVALYEYKDTRISITSSQLDESTSAWMFVQNPADFIVNGKTYIHSDGTTETVAASEDEIKAVIRPTIVRLTTDVDTFLNSEEGKLWRDTLEQYKITNQSVPVLGTDYLESIFEFHQNRAVISDGRSFDEEEYKNGYKVCIISESLALANNLKVGDIIPLAFYKGYQSYLEKSYNPPADVYSPVVGFSTESEPYKIIGIYRQSNLWADTGYTFTPNTIFVPNEAITCESYTDNSGIFYTLVLKNGSIDKMIQITETQGYKDIFYFYDQGYSGIKDTLSDYQSTARILAVIGSLTWIAMLILFFTLYVIRLKQTAGMMLSLGSGKRNTIIHILISTLMLVLIATAISGILGYTLLGNIIDYVYTNASSLTIINTSFSATASSDTSSVVNLTVQKLSFITVVVAVVQFIIFAIVTWIYSHIITRKKPLTLMKHKEN